MGAEKRWREYRVGQYSLGRLGKHAIVIWYEGKKRRRRRLGETEELPARAALDRFARLVERERLSDEPRTGDIMRAYIAHRRRDGKQADVMEYNWAALAPRFDKPFPHEIDDDMCRAYTRDRTEQGISPSTIWTELTRLRTGLNWAVKRGVINRAPHIWTPLKSPARSRVLSEDEAQRLLDACDTPHIKLFIILALTTAGRTGAILELTWDRVNFQEGWVDLRRPEKIDPLSKRTKKGRAKVLMNSYARAALHQAWPERICQHVIEWNGKPVARITKAFSRARVSAGLDASVTPHTIRHTAASWMETQGVEMAQIARFLGHKDARTTETIYAKPDVGYLDKAARAVDLKVVK